MKNKKGFTLIELIVSIVLVSVVLVTLFGSLIQLRNAYTVVHENSDVIVYTSSISRVINADINENNGIRYVSCETNGHKCFIILGNDSRRELIITENDQIVDDTADNIIHSNNKTTLKYYDTTKYDKTNNENDKSLIYIRTLELDKYNNEDTKVATSNGYNFYDMSATQYEYFNESNDNNIDAFTTITIRLLDGVNLDLSGYNITLYGAGRYDYSNYIGKAYTIDLDNSEADTAGTTSIDEVFGVGFFVAESPHRKKDAIDKIEIPTKGNQAFLGYYYKPYGVNVETKVIDSGGNIVANPRIFKNDVKLNEPQTGSVYAKWGECAAGFKVENGKCIQETYTVTLNKNQTGKTCNGIGTNSYSVKYQNLVDDVIIPQCEGHTFEGYLDTSNKMYHNRNGKGVAYYDKTANTTFNAKWVACAAGQFSLIDSQSCIDCTKGSFTNTQGSGSCKACTNGKTTSGSKQTSCNANCPNNNEHVLSWVTPVWNKNNTVTNECKISACKTGYDGEISLNKCTVNSYSIKYELDGGTAGSSSPKTAVYDQVVTISNPTKAGYSFAGWTFNGNTTTAIHGSSSWSNASTKVKDTTFKNLTPTNNGTVTMTANWEECPVGTFNPGGRTTCIPCAVGSITSSTRKTACTPCQPSGQAGSNGTTSGTGKSTCDASCNKAHVSTWKTASWSNNSTSNVCIIKSCVTGYSLTSNTNTCNANTYSISYELDGGSFGANHPTSATYDSAFTINIPSKEGYTFAGWNIANMDSVTHTYGTKTTTSKSLNGIKETSYKNLRSTSGTVTFTATWTINSYKLTVKPNGGTWGGKTTNQDFTQNYGTTKTISDPTAGPTYTISYDMNGTGITAPTSPKSVQRPFSSWSLSGKGSISGTTYTYGAGDGTLTATYNTTSSSFTLPAISKDGYTCKWAEGSTNGTPYAGGTSRTISGNTTYYAVCSVNSYKLTVKPNGGTWGGKTTDQEFSQNYGTTKTIAAPTAGPTYTISYDMNGTGITAPTSPKSVQRPFSSWTKSGSGSISGTTYTYGAGDGTLTATYKTTSSSFILPSISKSGYSCKWAEGSTSGTPYAGGTSRTISGNTTYYAVCSVNSYKLTVKPNGGTWGGKTTDQDFTQNYGTTKTISDPTAGPTYSITYNMNGTGIAEPTSPKSVQRPFSSWTKSGSGSISGTTYTYGAGAGTLTANYGATSSSFTLPAISKTGFSCQWAEGSTSGTKYAGGTTRTISGNTTYYAVCTSTQFTYSPYVSDIQTGSCSGTCYDVLHTQITSVSCSNNESNGKTTCTFNTKTIQTRFTNAYENKMYIRVYDGDTIIATQNGNYCQTKPGGTSNDGDYSWYDSCTVEFTTPSSQVTYYYRAYVDNNGCIKNGNYATSGWDRCNELSGTLRN